MSIARLALIERGHLSPTGEPTPKSVRFLMRRRTAPRPTFQQERELRGFFSGAIAGLEDRLGSNFQAMVTKLALFGKVAHPCLDCGGISEVIDKDTKTVIVEAKGGTGLATGSPVFKEWEQIEKLCGRPTDAKAVAKWLLQHNEAFEPIDGTRCHQCGGTGRQRHGRKKCTRCKGTKVGRVYLGVGDYFCQPCGGRGWKFKTLNDHKRASTVKVSGHEIPQVNISLRGGDNLFWYARIAGKVRAVRQRDPVASDVLRAYYAHDVGSLFNLWPLTTRGRQLLEEYPHLIGQGWHDTWWWTAAEKGQPDWDQGKELQKLSAEEPGFAAKCALANAEASHLRLRAWAVWLEVCGGG